MDFPKHFIFGAATAAYQCEGATKEGNKGRVIWDSYLEKEKHYTADPACDFYHQYGQDIENCRDFGLNGLRVSIAWSRIFPEGYGKVEPTGVAFYHRLFKKMIDNGIEPFVTLHHFDSPETLFKQGDWLNKDMIQHFVEYARFCFTEFTEITKWITINEPSTLAKQQNITGTFPPNTKYNFTACFQQQHNMNVAHAKVVKLFHDLKISGEIGIVHAIQTVYPYSENPSDKIAAKKQDVLENAFLLEGTLAGEYSEKTLSIINEILSANGQQKIEILDSELSMLEEAIQTVDFVGVNYYYSKFVANYDGKSQFIHNGTGDKGTSLRQLQGVGQELLPSGIPTTEWDWPIYPKGLADTLRRINHEFPNVKKIYITENGLGRKERPDENNEIVDDERIEYLSAHLQEVERVVNEGVNVQGYCVWSLQDLFSWTNGYNKRYGLFYVNFETQQRIPKKSAYWYKEVIEKNKQA